jgi:hypothetical protein
MRRQLGGQDERRLRVVEFARDLMHAAAVESARVGQDRELIAAERLVGEDIGGEVAIAHDVRWESMSPAVMQSYLVRSPARQSRAFQRSRAFER